MELTVLLTSGTELTKLVQQLDGLAKEYGHGKFLTYDANNHGPSFSCLTLTTSPYRNSDPESLKRESLKLDGVLEECPECAKRKKWGPAWVQSSATEVIERGLPPGTIIGTL